MSSVQSTVRIKIETASDFIVFVCRKPSAREVSKFLAARYTRHRNKMVDRRVDAQIEFAKSLLLDVENLSYEPIGPDGLGTGKLTHLNKATVLTDADKRFYDAADWRDIPQVNWLVSLAMHFEEPAMTGGSSDEDTGEEKN